MSVKTKKGFKKISKAIAVALFALLMFSNIKIATTDEAELAHSNFTIFGVKISLQDDTYGKRKREGMCGEICYISDGVCTYIVGYGYCSGYFQKK